MKKKNTVSLSALVAAAVAHGLTVEGTSRVHQSGKAKFSKGGKVRQNERLGYNEGDPCPWCESEFKATKTVESKNGERTRATFKTCKHTVNLYE